MAEIKKLYNDNPVVERYEKLEVYLYEGGHAKAEAAILKECPEAIIFRHRVEAS